MDASYAQAYSELYRRHWWWRAREEYLVSLLRGLSLPTDARILDVGCGAGLFFDQLGQFGAVEGVESHPQLCSQRADRRYRIHCSSFDDHFQPPGQYDLVLMLDVLEHLDDPLSALERAVDLLTPGGRLLITVPAFDLLWTSHDELNEHRTRYTRRKLLPLAKAAGVKVQDARYFFHGLFAAKLACRLKERLFGSRPSIPGIPPPPVNRLLYWICRFDNHWLSRLRPPLGNSLLLLGSKGTRPTFPPFGTQQPTKKQAQLPL